MQAKNECTCTTLCINLPSKTGNATISLHSQNQLSGIKLVLDGCSYSLAPCAGYRCQQACTYANKLACPGQLRTAEIIKRPRLLDSNPATGVQD